MNVPKLPQAFTGDALIDRARLAILKADACPWYMGSRKLMGFRVDHTTVKIDNAPDRHAWKIMALGAKRFSGYPLADIYEGSTRAAYKVGAFKQVDDYFPTFGEALSEALARACNTQKTRGY